VKALIHTAQQNNYSLRVLKAVEEVNDDQKSVLFNKVKRYFNGNLGGKTIALWGLSFKPETDDMREAPALVLIDRFVKAGCKVKAYDPEAMKETQRRIGDIIDYSNDPYEALAGADCLLLVTEWKEFRVPDFDRMKNLLKNHVIFDGRNIFDSHEIRAAGFEYFGIGQ
jgi:UDPglucose 6-dehydrogenase